MQGWLLLDAESVVRDAAYGSGAARAVLADAGHHAVIRAIPPRPAVPGGSTADDFTLDLTAGTVTFPNGLTRSISRAGVATRRRLRGCPLRARSPPARTAGR